MTRAVLAVLSLAVTSGVSAQSKQQPTHTEIAPIKIPISSANPKFDTMAMTAKGEILLAVSWDGTSLTRNHLLHFINPTTGKVRKSVSLGTFDVHILECCADGSIYVGGHGEILLLDADGKQKRKFDYKKIAKGYYKNAVVSGLASDSKHIYVGMGFSFSLRSDSDVVRFNRDFTAPKLVAEKQRGCCAHLDLQLAKGELLIAENSRHRVNRLTSDGKLLGRWGRRDRVRIEGFAACCNPVNLVQAKDGSIYTAESGIGRIKRYSRKGEFLGLVGYVDTTRFDRGSRLAAMSCYIPVEVSKSGDRVYIMDIRANIIRVLQRKKTAGR